MSKPRVAIVGAGISGLVALKECLAEGLEAVVFDAGSQIGGAWVYNPDTDDAAVHSSIYHGCMLNSCRDSTSFSDFPMDPARYPDYFRHEQFLRYLGEYADHFRLAKHVRLRTRVLEARPLEDGSWRVRVQEEGGGAAAAVEELTYSAVVVATGHLSKPKIPDFPGRDAFEGEFLHSHHYRTPARFEGKRVAIIGLGSSALDIACEIAPQAKELHVITRRGAWVLPRYCLGKPIEAWDNRATQRWVPASVADWLQTKLLTFVEGHPPKELKPEHKFSEQLPSVRGDFLEKVRTGLITLQRANVKSIAPTGIALTTGTTLEDIDVIICATGYDQCDIPYLPTDVLRDESTLPHRLDLYKLLVPVRYANLFVHGFLELFTSLLPSAEAQARFTASVVSGRIQLPPRDTMIAEMRAFQAGQARHYIQSERHATAVHGIEYVDDLLRPLGAVPTYPRLLSRVLSTGHPWRAWKALSSAWFGTPNSAMWRLCGYGADPALAEESLIRTAEGKNELSAGEKEILAERKAH